MNEDLQVEFLKYCVYEKKHRISFKCVLDYAHTGVWGPFQFLMIVLSDMSLSLMTSLGR